MNEIIAIISITYITPYHSIHITSSPFNRSLSPPAHPMSQFLTFAFVLLHRDEQQAL